MLEMGLASMHVAGTANACGQAPEAEGFDGVNLGDTQNLAADPVGAPRLAAADAERPVDVLAHCVSSLPELPDLHLDLALVVEGRDLATPGELRRAHRRPADEVLPARYAEGMTAGVHR